MNAIQLADAVVTVLNAATFSQEFTALRHYLPRFKITKGELDSLKVVVVPGAFTLERFEREGLQRDDQVTIGVLKKLAVPRDATHEELLAEIDPLVTLCEEIAAHFAPDDAGQFTFNGDAGEVTSVEASPLYAADHLENPRQFTGVIVLTVQQFDP